MNIKFISFLANLFEGIVINDRRSHAVIFLHYYIHSAMSLISLRLEVVKVH